MILLVQGLTIYLSMKILSVDNVFCRYVFGHDDQVVWIADSCAIDISLAV